MTSIIGAPTKSAPTQFMFNRHSGTWYNVPPGWTVETTSTGYYKVTHNLGLAGPYRNKIHVLLQSSNSGDRLIYDSGHAANAFYINLTLATSPGTNTHGNVSCTVTLFDD